MQIGLSQAGVVGLQCGQGKVFRASVTSMVHHVLSPVGDLHVYHSRFVFEFVFMEGVTLQCGADTAARLDESVACSRC